MPEWIPQRDVVSRRPKVPGGLGVPSHELTESFVILREEVVQIIVGHDVLLPLRVPSGSSTCLLLSKLSRRGGPASAWSREIPTHPGTPSPWRSGCQAGADASTATGSRPAVPGVVGPVR